MPPILTPVLPGSGGPGVSSHGALTGLADDDHPQYTTAAELNTAVTAAINAVIAAAPGALDTLDELAAALGDDANFAATLASTLALKAPLDLVGAPVERTFAASDELTAIVAGTGKITFRMPFAMTVDEVRASLTTPSSSGVVTIDINDGGTSILSTKLTIDANEKTSVTAATPAVISDSALADDAEITVDFDTAGTGAKGVKVTLVGTRA